jgi:excisionase family DNA binding protein
MMKPTGALLSAAEVADRFGWQVCTVRKKILRREIAYVKIGRSVRVPESEILRIIEEGYHPAINQGSQG